MKEPEWAEAFFNERGNPWTRADYQAFFTAFLAAHPGSNTRFGSMAQNDTGWLRALMQTDRDFRLSSLEKGIEHALKWDDTLALLGRQ